MEPDAAKYLFDIGQACRKIAEFSAGKSLADYEANDLLRSGVERQFEVVGEALSQLAPIRPEVAARISDFRQVISFRNVLAHAYAEIDDRLVWDMTQTRVGRL